VVRAAGIQLAAGAVIGAATVALGGRLLVSLLYGVGPADPVTIGAPAALLGTVTIVAGLIPAIRAARLDPARVLRE
jgi:ABC-type antimicrobial peptide transport system permease subunit